MNWNSTPSGVSEAIGGRGAYTVSHFSMGVYKLLGTGHDGLPMLAIPSGGRHFHTADQARNYAEELDGVPHTEPQASGA